MTEWLGLTAEEEATEAADEKREGKRSEESRRAEARETTLKPATRKAARWLGSRRRERKRPIVAAAEETDDAPGNATGGRRGRREGQQAAAGEDARAKPEDKKRKPLITPAAYRRPEKKDKAEKRNGDGKGAEEADCDQPKRRARQRAELDRNNANEATDSRGPTFDVTGRRRPKAGANLQAQLAGGPVDGGVGRQMAEKHWLPALR